MLLRKQCNMILQKIIKIWGKTEKIKENIKCLNYGSRFRTLQNFQMLGRYGCKEDEFVGQIA